MTGKVVVARIAGAIIVGGALGVASGTAVPAFIDAVSPPVTASVLDSVFVDSAAVDSARRADSTYWFTNLRPGDLLAVGYDTTAVRVQSPTSCESAKTQRLHVCAPPAESLAALDTARVIAIVRDTKGRKVYNPRVTWSLGSAAYAALGPPATTRDTAYVLLNKPGFIIVQAAWTPPGSTTPLTARVGVTVAPPRVARVELFVDSLYPPPQ